MNLIAKESNLPKEVLYVVFYEIIQSRSTFEDLFVHSNEKRRDKFIKNVVELVFLL